MTRHLWSINALAEQFDLDRRTVRQVLRTVRPCGELRGHPAWTLPVASAVLVPYARQRGTLHVRRQAEPPSPPPLPPGWTLLAEVEGERGLGYAIATLTTLYEMQRLAMSVAVDEGVPIGRAFNIANTMMLAMAGILAGKAKFWGLEPWASAANPHEADLGLEDAAFVHANWPHMALTAGEPDWEPPAYVTAWLELSAEKRAEAVARGAAEAEAFAAELAAEREADALAA
jgi:hypothetical protein